jgi:hypothetical protein
VRSGRQAGPGKKASRVVRWLAGCSRGTGQGRQPAEASWSCMISRSSDQSTMRPIRRPAVAGDGPSQPASLAANERTRAAALTLLGPPGGQMRWKKWCMYATTRTMRRATRQMNGRAHYAATNGSTSIEMHHLLVNQTISGAHLQNKQMPLHQR